MFFVVFILINNMKGINLKIRFVLYTDFSSNAAFYLS